MRLLNCHIYGFGKFEDAKIEFSLSNIQVIYGDNEAGKSTLLAFIETMLFGFPKKNQTERRYEPKTGRVHGGKIDIEVPQHGRLSIERVYGRTSGELTVQFADGAAADESVLEELLGGLDRSLFRGLFFTTLDGLQEMEKVNQTDFNRYLFGTGVSGIHSLFQLEERLSKKKAEIFKPQGRKPHLNHSLEELEELYKKIRQWEQKLHTYQALTLEESEYNAELEVLQHERKRFEKEKNRSEKLQVLQPYMKEKQALTYELNELPHIESFPEDGVERLEKWHRYLVDAEAECSNIQKRLLALKEDLPPENNQLLSFRSTLDSLQKKEQLYQIKKEENLVIRQKLEKERENLFEIFEYLGPQWTEQTLQTANTSFTEQEALARLVSEEEKLLQQKNYLDQELERSRRQLETAEANAAFLKKDMLSDNKRKRFEAFINEADQMKNITREKDFLEQMVKEITEQRHSLPRLLPVQTIFIIVMAGSLISVLFFLLNYFQTATAVIIGVFIFIFITTSLRRGHEQRLKKLDEKKHHYETRLRAFNDAVVSTNSKRIEDIRVILQRDREIQQSWNTAHAQIVQGQNAYTAVVDQYDQWELQLQKVQFRLRELGEKHNFPPALSGRQLLNIFEKVKSAKKSLYEHERLHREHKERSSWLINFEEELHTLSDAMFLPEADKVSVKLAAVKEKILAEEAKKLERSKILVRIQELKEQQALVEEKKQQYQKASSILLQAAGCVSESEFRKKGKIYKELLRIKEQLIKIESQLGAIVSDAQERQELIRSLRIDENYVIRIRQTEESIKKIDNKITGCYRRLAEINIEKKQLEEGTIYSELLQTFEMRKSEFQEKAKQWAVYAAAEHLLHQTKERYRKERQPKVIEAASEYFRTMTAGEYSKIAAPIDRELFLVESKSGVRFKPQELSRGTKEQLYLSLRLALAKVFQASFVYPILLDDIFVNFDKQRIKQAVKVIRYAAGEAQVLFFTCHEHQLKEFSPEEICNIEHIQNSSS